MQATRKCIRCGKIRVFRGADIQAIMAQMDDEHWRDRPKDDGDLCCDCAQAEEEMYDATWEEVV